MSIILGPYGNKGRGSSEQRENDDELFVFGYACKLFRDDAKGLLENSGQMLIPWMGDGSLMVDRYDIRNRLEDKSQFGLKPILPRRKKEEEEEMEELLDQERYLSLGVDMLEHELLEEETKKRACEDSSNYQAVGFAYEKVSVQEAKPTPAVPVPLRPEHPPTSAVDVLERGEGPFVMPEGLVVPGHIRKPATQKLHSIIERTAGFVATQGTQMEIMIKAKQKYNPFFSFVSVYDPLYLYYRHLLRLIASGEYVPRPGSSEVGEGGGGEGVRREERRGANLAKEEEAVVVDGTSDSEAEDSDGEGFELHPLLRVSTTPRSSPKPHTTKNPPSPPTTTATPSTAISTTGPTYHHHSSPPPLRPSSTNPSFYAKSLNVNAAPSLDRDRGDTMTSYSAHSYSHPSAESSQHPVAPDGQSYQHLQYQYPDGYSYHHPHPSDYSSQYSLEAYYHRLSAEHISNKMGASGAPPPLGYNAGPPPPPPDLQPIIDKTAEYVARNSEDFERTVLEKHCGDPKFGFLNPWNKYYPYYKMRLQQNKEKAAEDALAAIEKDFQRMQKEETAKGEKIQKLSQSGTVSFKLQPKRVAKVLETEAVDFGPLADEESEQEEDARSEGRVQSGTPLNTPYTQQESYQALQGGYMTEQNGYMTEDGSQAALDMNEYQDDSRLHPSQYQSYPSEEYVHYSSEGTYYYPSDNGELEVDYDEDPPDAKRAKTDNVVMDNKVQEFLSQVKAVLDT